MNLINAAMHLLHDNNSAVSALAGRYVASNQALPSPPEAESTYNKSASHHMKNTDVNKRVKDRGVKYSERKSSTEQKSKPSDGEGKQICLSIPSYDVNAVLEEETVLQPAVWKFLDPKTTTGKSTCITLQVKATQQICATT